METGSSQTKVLGSDGWYEGGGWEEDMIRAWSPVYLWACLCQASCTEWPERQGTLSPGSLGRDKNQLGGGCVQSPPGLITHPPRRGRMQG